MVAEAELIKCAEVYYNTQLVVYSTSQNLLKRISCRTDFPNRWNHQINIYSYKIIIGSSFISQVTIVITHESSQV